MLCIRQTRHLLQSLDTTAAELNAVLSSPESFYEELLLLDPRKPNKRRLVVNVQDAMRRYQLRLYRRILLPKLVPSPYSHGGIKSRSIKTNAEPHLGSRFVFKADISNYYPSIHYKRVYRLFVDALQCSPDVARLCTKISTYKHHLALGLITSPILADQVLRRVDRRIAGLCGKNRLTYTRYVDDITISGPYDLRRSGFVRLVERILADDGFKTNPDKNLFGQLTADLSITNLREVRGHLDVRREYVDELIRQIEDAARLARDEEFQGPYYTPGQILGRVRFVCWVNPGRREDLVRRYRSVRWPQVRERARERGLEATRITLRRIRNESTRLDDSTERLKIFSGPD
jgi:RNA-directed DNA polymerase